MRYRWTGLGVAGAALVTASPAQAQKRDYTVPAQDAAPGIAALARQAKVQILVADDVARGHRTNAVEGRFSVREAIDRLLRRTGLHVMQTGEEAFTVVAEAPPGLALEGAVPEILVTGRRDWSLNTGIERSQNDSQPFVVFDREAIRRSGAQTVEGFLRDQLSVNASPGNSERPGSGHQARSSINLRGLGERETLVLVDGRRLPSVNNGDGTVGQGSILGIPLASIERIEVLASSASGIYGAGATGGVVNIILRRDSRGVELSAMAGGTYDGGGFERRLDATGSFALEGGRSSLSVAGSLRKVDPVLLRDRGGIVAAAKRRALANDPDYYFRAPPLSAGVNLATWSGDPLQLKPEYGGTVLGSSYTHLPRGYRGLALDGTRPLVANAGAYDLSFSPTAGPGGGASRITTQVEQMSLSVALRRDMNSWLKAYAEVSGNRSTTIGAVSRAPNLVTLAADAPDNPFTEDVLVARPYVGAEATTRTANSQYRALFGAIAILPHDWKAVLDLTLGRNTYATSPTDPGFAPGYLAELADGGVDILRDPATFPLSYRYIDSRYGTYQDPSVTRQRALSLRLAGPLPVKLPAGQLALTLSAERNVDDLGGVRSLDNNSFSSQVLWRGKRSQRIDALYGELTAPLLGGRNTLPLVHELSVTLALRHERYRGRGGGRFECYVGPGPLPGDDLLAQCPPPGGTVPIGTTRNSSTNPTISARWEVLKGVMLRGSYATGYVPPQLDQLVKVPFPFLPTDALDPLRGNEPIGVPTGLGYNALPGFTGGNPSVLPETSRSWTAGVVLEPAFATGLRLSADWTRIRKRNNYADVSTLAFADGDPARRIAFLAFLEAFPDRSPRGAPSGGYAVGPIESLDLSLANFAGSLSETIDFVGDYAHALWSGTLTIGGRATYTAKLEGQTLLYGPTVDYAGVVANQLFSSAQVGGLRWRGTGHIRWADDRLGLGWQTRYFDGYYLNVDRSVLASQGGARVRRQIYHDLTASYAFDHGVTLRAAVSNLFNAAPAIDTNDRNVPFSSYADIRGGTYALTLTKAF